jgi:DNA-binding NtrC family response regulator
MANAAKPVSKLKLLYSEGDVEVLASQAASMQKAGYPVETAPDRKTVQEALRRGTFDLVILGPTLSKNDRHHLAYMVKKANQTTRVLVMHTDGERHPAVDANLDTGCSIDAVLAKIATLSSTLQPALTRAASAGK